jgi:hypothetical protein
MEVSGLSLGFQACAKEMIFLEWRVNIKEFDRKDLFPIPRILPSLGVIRWPESGFQLSQ